MKLEDYLANVDLEQKIEYIEWAAEQTGWSIDPHDKTWITNKSNDGDILAVAFFHNWRPGGNVELGLATNKKRNGLSRQFIRTTFRYGFLMLKVARITVTVYSTPQHPNCNWLSQLQRMGGVVEVTLKNWFGAGIDGVMLRFTPEEVKQGPFGQVIFGD